MSHNKLQQDLLLDKNLPDGKERLAALNPEKSFIVQAPAGSGKTALLTQRFLALLSVVEKPEQIVAMTFTKKAAGEMRERIFETLKLSLNPLAENASLFDKNGWLLSQAALQQNKRYNWQLLKNPNRLRIRTIDSMNGYLVQQMPLLSRLGAQPQMAEQNDELYRQAAREALKSSMVADAVGEILRLVNGRYNKAENLLVVMLQKRDQWMKYIAGIGDEESREFLELSLSELVEQERKKAIALLGNRFDSLNQLASLAGYAVQNDYKPVEILQGKLFSVNQTDNALWRSLADWLLTSNNQLRKTVNKRQGFPAGKGEAKEFKDKFIAALSDCRAASNFDKFEEGLAVLKSLPEPRYAPEEWQSLSHLISLLKLAVAHLKLIFQQAAQADFIEVSQAASQALGSEIEPTDLAEKLDYQLKHLLIDEFQDTSVGQFSLVKKLTATWVEGDGRSLFIVGDPMQSIYRFREAEVGNFLTAWQGVLGSIKIKPLSLLVNFRSKQGVVNWVNDAFKLVMPKQDDIQNGAVSYSASKTLSASEDKAIECRWSLNQTSAKEVDLVVKDIEALRASACFIENKQTLGVLGRSRSVLMPIAVALKQKGIPFRAVELEELSQRQEIQDAVALTRALLHLGDRPAWVALLRSPLIGFSLVELYELLGENEDYFQIPVLSSWAKQDSLFSDQLTILQTAITHLGDQSLSHLVRDTWFKLDGAQSVADSLSLDNLSSYWAMLADFDGEDLNIKSLENALKKLYAEADSSSESSQIELMTMHKSKGLEFDFVFLPGLGKQPRADDLSLVSWLPFSNKKGERLVLSPLHRRGKGASALTELIKRFEQIKKDYELGRLLYVAVTRAKNKCYLYGSVKFDDTKEELILAPVKRSLLDCLWSVVETDFYGLVDSYKPTKNIENENNFIPKISRLPEKRTRFIEQFIQKDLQATEQKIELESEMRVRAKDLDIFSFKTESFVTAIGDLLHAILETAVNQSLDMWQWENIQQLFPVYENWLFQKGITKQELPEAMRRLQVSLKHALQNKKLCWSLQSNHQDSSTELALTTLSDESTVGVQNHIVDRSFIDDKGVRWIIDYKSSFFVGDENEKQNFIAQQIKKYRPQLERYGSLFALQESREQKWVLYFSYVDAWVELI